MVAMLVSSQDSDYRSERRKQCCSDMRHWRGGSCMMRKILRIFAVLLLTPFLQTGSSAAEPHWPPVLTLSTASPGGTYFAYGEGLAQILTRALGILVVAR